MQISKFIKIEWKSDSDSDSDLDLDLDLEVESKSDSKLMEKLENYDSDSELKNLYLQLQKQPHWFGK